MAKDVGDKMFTLAIDQTGAYDTRPPGDTTAPTVPVITSVVAGGTTSLVVTWAASTDSQSGVAGYNVRVNGVAYGSRTTALGVTITGLVPDTAYTISVNAEDNTGNASAYTAGFPGVTDALPPTGSSGTYITVHEDDFQGTSGKMRSNYSGSPATAVSDPADYTGPGANSRWQKSPPGDLCYADDAPIYLSTDVALSGKTRSALCQLTLNRAGDTNGKIERNEIVNIPYTSGGTTYSNVNFLREREYWLSWSIYLPVGWKGSDVYCHLIQFKSPDGGSGLVSSNEGPFLQLGPDYGYKPTHYPSGSVPSPRISDRWHLILWDYNLNASGVATSRKSPDYDVDMGEWTTGAWTNFVMRYTPSWRDSWVDAEGNNRIPLFQLWINGVQKASRVVRTTVAGVPKGYANCIPRASDNLSTAVKQGIYCGWASPTYDIDGADGRAIKWKHYRGHWVAREITSRTDAADWSREVSTSDFGYQSVLQPGLS